MQETPIPVAKPPSFNLLCCIRQCRGSQISTSLSVCLIFYALMANNKFCTAEPEDIAGPILQYWKMGYNDKEITKILLQRHIDQEKHGLS